jgi:hypothetical protein
MGTIATTFWLRLVSPPVLPSVISTVSNLKRQLLVTISYPKNSIPTTRLSCQTYNLNQRWH